MHWTKWDCLKIYNYATNWNWLVVCNNNNIILLKQLMKPEQTFLHSLNWSVLGWKKSSYRNNIIWKRIGINLILGTYLELENSKSFPFWEKMIKATSTSQRTESSYAFFRSPTLRFEKVTCLLVAFSIRFISTFPLTIFLQNYQVNSLSYHKICRKKQKLKPPSDESRRTLTARGLNLQGEK